jgi:hypothetical protein
VIAPEQGQRGAKTIPLNAETLRAIDGFISAVWDHMDGWGIAGKGMYWRPVLDVYVVPGGEQRFADLSALLDGSGLLITESKGQRP